MQYALYTLAGFITFGVLATITSIGKPRKAVSPGQAAFLVLSNAFWVVVVVLAARRLS